MLSDKVMNSVMCLFIVLVSGLVVASKASGGVILDAGIRETYEDNLNGSPADADKKGDFYTTVSASAGGYTEVVDGTYLFLRGDAATYLYSKYNDLNATLGGISAGVYKELGDVFSAQLALKGKLKNFKGTLRDSSAYGGTFELKQQISPDFWIKEGYEYEKNDADSRLFSYNGHSVGVWSGYLITPKTMFNLGYSYLTRKYEDAFGFRTKSHTISAGIVRELVKKVYVNLGYDRQFNDSNVANTDYKNNIYTLGVTYSF
ncbi:MAG: hypothetical protein M1353_00805 [Nitrospirae bacterium]|nr:hypothetical protein [Nitrospirota bacterium]